MIDLLHREFAARADRAPDADGMLLAVHARVAVRRRHRRRVAMAGVVGAVAAVSAGAVLLAGPAHPPAVAAVPPAPAAPADTVGTVTPVGSMGSVGSVGSVGSKTSGEQTVSLGSKPAALPGLTYLPGDPGTACDGNAYQPPPTPLVPVPASAGSIALTDLPQGWTRTFGDDANAYYSAPADPRAGTGYAGGQLIVLVSAVPDADVNYETTIGGRPATVRLTDPCATAGYPGSWMVGMRYAAGVQVQVQGPLSLRLSVAQIRQIAASVVVRTLVVGKG